MDMSAPRENEEVRGLVRAADPDRYLTALLAPKQARAGLMALYAFNAELNRIPDLVSEPALGEIRLQWWRDILEQLGDGAETGAPVADALGRAIAAYDLPRPLLLGLADARSADLDGGGFDDMQALKAYLYKTSGALFELSARILGDQAAEDSRAVHAAAVAYGIARLLLALPMDAAAGRVMLPLTTLREHDLTPEEVLAGSEGKGVFGAVGEMAQEARTALAKAREGISVLETPARGVFAPLALVEPALTALEKPGVRPLYDVTQINPLMRFLRLWRAARMGRY